VRRLISLLVLTVLASGIVVSSAFAGGAAGCEPTLPGSNACGFFVKGQTYGDYATYTGTSAETGQPIYSWCNDCEPMASHQAGIYLSPGGGLNISQADGLRVIGGGIELTYQNPLGSPISLTIPFNQLPALTVLQPRSFRICHRGKLLHGSFVDAWIDLYIPGEPIPASSALPGEA